MKRHVVNVLQVRRDLGEVLSAVEFIDRPCISNVLKVGSYMLDCTLVVSQ